MSKTQQPKDETQMPKAVPIHARFILGSIAGIGAASICHPLDFLKTRMQLRGEGTSIEHITFIHMAKDIAYTEGPLALFDGLSACVVRQFFYTSVRTAIFTSLLDMYTSKDGEPPGVLRKMGIGVITGIVATFTSIPFDVVLVRMSADGRLPPENKRNYRHVGDAFHKIVAEEGILTLYRGLMPTMYRSIVIATASFVTYLQAKEFLIKNGIMGNTFVCQLTSSMISGLVTTATSIPFDAMKTRLQNMKIIDGKPEYSGMFDAGAKIIRKEGFFSLFKGFTPYYLRQGPFTVIYFLLIEPLTKQYRKYFLSDTSGASF